MEGLVTNVLLKVGSHGESERRVVFKNSEDLVTAVT